MVIRLDRMEVRGHRWINGAVLKAQHETKMPHIIPPIKRAEVFSRRIIIETVLRLERGGCVP